MIYTCTLNPSIDYIMKVDSVEAGGLNRSQAEKFYPGGKGINVSRLLTRLGRANEALGFIGGFTGDFVENFLHDERVQTHFIRVSQPTRINVKIKGQQETEINGKGPAIGQRNVDNLYAQVDQLKKGDILVLAGSIPASLPANLYEQIFSRCDGKGIKVVVDTSGKRLLDLLKLKPFLVKPNHHELGEFFDVDIKHIKDAVEYGNRLLEMGAENVIVSMGSQGAVFLGQKERYHAMVPPRPVKNSVGAGDSMVAGFIGSYERNRDMAEAFRNSVASGSATAFSSDLATKDDIEHLVPLVQMKKL